MLCFGQVSAVNTSKTISRDITFNSKLSNFELETNEVNFSDSKLSFQFIYDVRLNKTNTINDYLNGQCGGLSGCRW